MTVVPLSFQLCGWIPAWWRGTAGGDDLLELLGLEMVASVSPLRTTTVTLSAYCPELGVAVLPGPKPVTEAAVAAGEAVILHGGPGQPSTVLIPGEGLLQANPARPVDIDVRAAGSEFAQAVVTAEHELRSAGTVLGAEPPRPATVRPLPPGASGERKALLVRAVRVWSAVAALPVSARTPALSDVLTSCARATLATYRESVVPSPDRARRFA